MLTTRRFLEAQLLSNKIDVTDSLIHGSLAFSTISPLFVGRFGRSLRFYHVEFEFQVILEAELMLLKTVILYTLSIAT